MRKFDAEGAVVGGNGQGLCGGYGNGERMIFWMGDGTSSLRRGIRTGGGVAG